MGCAVREHRPTRYRAVFTLLSVYFPFTEPRVSVSSEGDNPGVQGDEMIPKVVHYFWFGPAEKPKLVQRCIASWRARLPDYEFKEWTEANYDVHKSAFMSEAYANGDWGYIGDFARLDVLYQYGGIYLDVDVEVFKDFTPVLSNKTFFGFMFDCNLCTAVIGSLPGQPVIGELLSKYDHLVGDRT